MKKLWMLGVLLLAQAGFGEVLPDEAETLFPAGRKGAVIIALDGGTRGQFAEIVPVVERHGMTALVNVNVAKIGVDPAYMTWDDVRALLARGHVPGAMVEHNPLVEKGHKANIAELEAALERIRTETGVTPIATFYGWPGCSNDIRLELERRGIEHQVWRGPNLTRQPEERLKQGCADSIARSHHQILPVSAMSDKDRTAWLPAFARALDALKAMPEIWTPTLLEARARKAAYRRYAERMKKERQLAERYVASAVRAEVVNEDGASTASSSSRRTRRRDRSRCASRFPARGWASGLCKVRRAGRVTRCSSSCPSFRGRSRSLVRDVSMRR